MPRRRRQQRQQTGHIRFYAGVLVPPPAIRVCIESGGSSSIQDLDPDQGGPQTADRRLSIPNYLQTIRRFGLIFRAEVLAS
ncbi:hypothetical protein ANTPLA_LOCUS3608 [Anthophora plagiata]